MRGWTGEEPTSHRVWWKTGQEQQGLNLCTGPENSKGPVGGEGGRSGSTVQLSCTSTGRRDSPRARRKRPQPRPLLEGHSCHCGTFWRRGAWVGWPISGVCGTPAPVAACTVRASPCFPFADSQRGYAAARGPSKAQTPGSTAQADTERLLQPGSRASQLHSPAGGVHEQRPDHGPGPGALQ